MFLSEERNAGRRKRGIDAGRKLWSMVCLIFGTRRNMAGGKRKGKKGKGLAMFKSQ